jgi:flavorubredoxin
MRAVVVYESMFDNTHAIADAIGQGLEPVDNVVDHLEADEEARAREWAKQLAASVASKADTDAGRPGRLPTPQEP